MKLADALITAACWCGRDEVEVPVVWVREGRTSSCDASACVPGCELVDDDDDDSEPDPYDEEPYEPRKVKMNKFNPNKYDPRSDSTPGLPRREGSISLLVGRGLCGCGCGSAPAGNGARFLMGHDAKLKGKLARVLAARLQVALVEETTGTTEVLDPVEYAARFSTKKVDWAGLVRASADKVLERRGAVDRRAAERAVLDRATRDGAVRVGRWDATDSVAAIYRLDGGGYEVEFVELDGSIRQTQVKVA
jgi:hypothetical protein